MVLQHTKMRRSVLAGRSVPAEHRTTIDASLLAPSAVNLVPGYGDRHKPPSCLDVVGIVLVQNRESAESRKILSSVFLRPNQAAVLHLIENPTVPNKNPQRLARAWLSHIQKSSCNSLCDIDFEWIERHHAASPKAENPG
jgi:hypothetical protein